MNNPYNLVKNIKPVLPNDCISHVFSFYRPTHNIVESMKNNFLRCGKCDDVVRTYDGQISLRYYTIGRGCITCGHNDCIICRDCTADTCDCGSDDESCYSWFSF
jgi:hypothetical protein